MGNKVTSDTKLTPKQHRFAIEYRKDGEGKAAAIRAGYSAKTAAAIACDLLKLPKIRNMIEKEERDALDRCRSDADWVLERLEREADDMDSPAAARIRALELLGKRHRLFVDQKEVRHTHEATFFANVDMEPLEADFEDVDGLIEYDDQSEDD